MSHAHLHNDTLYYVRQAIQGCWALGSRFISSLHYNRRAKKVDRLEERRALLAAQIVSLQTVHSDLGAEIQELLVIRDRFSAAITELHRVSADVADVSDTSAVSVYDPGEDEEDEIANQADDEQTDRDGLDSRRWVQTDLDEARSFTDHLQTISRAAAGITQQEEAEDIEMWEASCVNPDAIDPAWERICREMGREAFLRRQMDAGYTVADISRWSGHYFGDLVENTVAPPPNTNAHFS